MDYAIKVEKAKFNVHVEMLGDRLYRVSFIDRDHRVDVLEISENLYSMICDGQSFEVDIREEGNAYEVFIKGRSYFVEVLQPGREPSVPIRETEEASSSAEEVLTTPMTGKVVKILVTVGQPVEFDQVLLIVESMKMEMPISSPCRGKVKEVLVKEGEIAETGTNLVTLTRL